MTFLLKSPPRQAAPERRTQKSRRQTRRTTSERADPPQEADSDSNSDSDSDGPRYWLRIPAERIQEVPTAAPPQRPAITVSRPIPVPVREEVRVDVDYLPEVDLVPVREAETVEPEQDEVQSDDARPEEQDGYAEAREPIQEEQPLVNAMPDRQTEIRRSSRDRQPRQMLTYERLGQPTLTTQASVNMANTYLHSPAYTTPHTTQPLHPFIPYATPTYPFNPYSMPCPPFSYMPYPLNITSIHLTCPRHLLEEER